jgi:NADPH:quinone reductase-like Zn-dependent oxidoreductase
VGFVTRFGAHQSQVCLPGSQVAPLPDALEFEAAAVMPVDYLTAQQALFEFGHLRPGSHVLVHLAAGSVGSAALQLCGSVEGVTVYGTAPTSRHEELRALGCRHPIDPAVADYRSEVMRLTHSRGVDLILDPLGGPQWRAGYSLLRPAGLLVVLGAAHLHVGGPWAWLRALWGLARMPRFSPLQLLADGRGIAGVDLARLFDDDALLQTQIRALMDRAASPGLQPRPGRSYPFSEAEAAHRAVENGTARCKPVLVPG